MVKLCLLFLVLAVICVQLGDTTAPARNNHARKKAVATPAARPVAKAVAKPPAKPVATNNKVNQVKKAGTVCEDKASNCNKMIPHCTTKEYMSTMKTNCALTCGHCAAPANKCKDNYSKCREWGTQQFCKNRGTTPQEKRAMCAKTCNLCQPANANPGTNPATNPATNPGTNPATNPVPGVDCKTDKYNAKCIEATCSAIGEKKTTQRCIDYCKIGANSNSPACDTKPANAPAVNCADKYDSGCIVDTCLAEKSAPTPKCLAFCSGTAAAPSPNANSAACNTKCNTKFDVDCMENTCSNPQEKLKSSECIEFCNGKNQNSIACKPNCVDKYDPECIEDTCTSERAPGPPRVKATSPQCVSFCADTAAVPAVVGPPAVPAVPAKPSPNANSAACNINCADKFSPACLENTCNKPEHKKNPGPECKAYCFANPFTTTCNPQCPSKYDSPCIRTTCKTEKAAGAVGPECTAFCLPPVAGPPAVPGGPGVGTDSC